MPELLKKIVVNNVGVLRAFNTPSSPQFEALTSFYARNGRGKTTLSCILRSVAANDPVSILGRRTLGQQNSSPEVTLVFDSGKTRFVNGKWEEAVDQIEVFDSTFIAENLYSGEAVELSHDRAMFRVILGRAGVKLAKQQDFFVAAAKRSAQKFKEAELAQKDDLPSDMTREEFFAYNPTDDLDQRIEQAEKDFKRIRQGDQLSKLKKFQLITKPTLEPGIAETLASTVSEINADARELLKDHFKKYHLGKEGEAWVRFGLQHVHDDSCPFCGRADVDAIGLITVYGQIFGDAYQSHLDRIRSMAKKVEDVLGSEVRAQISAVAVANAEALSNWSEFFAIGDKQFPDLAGVLMQIVEAHDCLKAMLDAKRQAPLIPIHNDDDLRRTSEFFVKINSFLTSYNTAVAELQSFIEDRMRASSSMTEPQARDRLLNLRKRHRRAEVGVGKRIDTALAAKRRDSRAKRMRTIVQDKLKEKNEENAQHYNDRVNYYLKKFSAKFSVSKFTNSMSGNAGQIDYGLIVRGCDVGRGRGREIRDKPTFMNTLSTGDKTTLAFAFFLAQLDTHSQAMMKDRIIVFDDPMSSHDTHRQARTIDFLFDLCGKCAQIIVLSHDAYFLRRLHRRCNQSTKVVYEIEFDGPEDWSVAKVADLDQLCESEHAKSLKKLRGYFDKRFGDPSDVAPAVRTVLETHYRCAYPAYFGPETNLGKIVDTIEAAGDSHPCWDDRGDLDSCNANTLQQHHGEDPRVPASKPIDPDELHGIVKTCLLLVHAIDA